MRVRMQVGVSGTRHGQPWPPIGAVLECDESEGRDLINGGLAVAEPDPPKAQPPDADVEKRPAPAADVETRRTARAPRKP